MDDLEIISDHEGNDNNNGVFDMIEPLKIHVTPVQSPREEELIQLPSPKTMMSTVDQSIVITGAKEVQGISPSATALSPLDFESIFDSLNSEQPKSNTETASFPEIASPTLSEKTTMSRKSTASAIAEAAKLKLRLREQMLQIRENQKSKLYDIFMAMDIHRKGHVGVDDLHQGIASLEMNLKEEEYEIMIKDLHRSRSQNISFKEFFDYFEADYTPKPKVEIAPKTKANHNGGVDAAQSPKFNSNEIRPLEEGFEPLDESAIASPGNPFSPCSAIDSAFELLHGLDSRTIGLNSLAKDTFTTVKVLVHGGNNLYYRDAETPNTFCSCQFGEFEAKSEIVEADRNPKWNCSLQFEYPAEDIISGLLIQVFLVDDYDCVVELGRVEVDIWDIIKHHNVQTISSNEISVQTMYTLGTSKSSIDVTLGIISPGIDKFAEAYAVAANPPSSTVKMVEEPKHPTVEMPAESASELKSRLAATEAELRLVHEKLESLQNEYTEERQQILDNASNAPTKSNEEEDQMRKAELQLMMSMKSDYTPVSEAQETVMVNPRIEEFEKIVTSLNHSLDLSNERYRNEVDKNRKLEKAMEVAEMVHNENVTSLHNRIETLEQALRVQEEAFDANRQRLAELESSESERLRVQNDPSRRLEKSTQADVDDMFETMNKLNAIVDSLRDSEATARRELREAKATIDNQKVQLETYTTQQETQSQEIFSYAGEVQRSNERVINLREQLGDEAVKFRQIETDLHRTKAERDNLAMQLESANERIRVISEVQVSRQNMIDSLRQNILEMDHELSLLRNYRSGSTAHLHAQSLVIQRMKAEKSDDIFLRRLNSAQRLQEFSHNILQPLRQLGRDVRALKIPVIEFGDFLLDFSRRWRNISEHRLVPTQKFIADAVPDQRALNAREALHVARNQQIRRMRVHDASLSADYHHIFSYCSVYQTLSKEDALVTMQQGIPSVDFNPLPDVGELEVSSEAYSRYFVFDHVALQDGDIESYNTKPNLPAISSHLTPIVDSVFDGNRALIVCTGPASTLTTNSILGNIFDIVELEQTSHDGTKIGISCVNVCGGKVFDMLLHSEGTSSFLDSISFDRIAARATGRISFNMLDATFVDVHSKYEASLVVTTAIGNHHAAASFRSLHDHEDSQADSHLVFNISVQSVDPITGRYSYGEIRVVHLASLQANKQDEAVDTLVHIMSLLRQQSKAKKHQLLTETSPQTLLRVFCRSVLLALLRDCLDDHALGLGSSQGEDDFASSRPCHLLVHTSLCVVGNRDADLLTALLFANSIRTEPRSTDVVEHARSATPARAIRKIASPVYKKMPSPQQLTNLKSPLNKAEKGAMTPKRLRPRLDTDDEEFDIEAYYSSGVESTPRIKYTSAEKIRAQKRVIEVLIDQSEGMLHTLFMSMDSGRTGSLSKQEFCRGLQRIDPTLCRRDILIFVDTVDTDHDGQIQFHDFFSVLGDVRPPRRTRQAQESPKPPTPSPERRKTPTKYPVLYKSSLSARK